LVGGILQVDRAGLKEWIYAWQYQYVDGRGVWTNYRAGFSYCVTAGMGIRRVHFAELRGFDTVFGGASAEDQDFCRKAQVHGLSLAEAPAAVVLYQPRLTINGLLAQRRTYAHGNLALAEKWGDPRKVPSLRLAIWRAAKIFLHWWVRDPSGSFLEAYARSRSDFERSVIELRGPLRKTSDG